ncbi:MAG: hypothetical protein GC153_13150 [Alphaproteobacteria bacterium]|nr:hypothetical protein [Alphaproteobacteria bacterium]
MISVLASVLLANAAPAASSAAPDGETVIHERTDPDYEACIKGLDKDLAKGREAAMQWQAMGGGPAAEHCLAVADLASGFPKLAAVRLQTLAGRPEAGDPLVRARLYSQAALAWLEAGQNELAGKALDEAFKLAPGAGELYLIKAQIEFAEGHMQATVDAVTEAESKGFETAESHVLRGRALYALARNREAAEDVIAALKLDPLNIDALVLRGDLHRAGVNIKAHYKRAPDKTE